MKRALGLTIAALALLCQAGCGTVFNFWPKDEHSVHEDMGKMRVYGGVRLDGQALGEARWPWGKVLAILILTVEFPLSLVMDTATLPVTIPVSLSR
ncbi:MAG TPA: YceK/YidQ family lipoprotein [Planctomycetota bacterium]|nr:YceK/YidQ family lipoprotein [Planctomycetota bacterium]